MSCYTKAIAVFEEEGERIRQKYLDKASGSTKLSLAEAVERDEELNRCQWAIDLLHEANKKESGK